MWRWGKEHARCVLERLIPRRAPAHWLADAELVELHDCDVSRDPVRPELDAQFRRAHGRKILGLRLNERTLGVVCVAFVGEVPASLREMDLLSQIAHLRGDASICCAYTIWSDRRGAGRGIITRLAAAMQKQPEIERLITLSPLSPQATHFHLSCGARLLDIGMHAQNFEYSLDGDVHA